ncbi:MAG: 5'-nucleotidase C-terminal domain-containing protein [Actinomycetota bacterium]
MKRRLTPMLVLAMVASLMVVATSAGAADRFEDVPDENTFHDDIAWLAEEGITRGCNPPDNDEFCPEREVTRGEMAAFFQRALDLGITGGGTDFTDTDGNTFENDILRLSAADITRGCNPPDNDEFCPEREVTRGEMAAFFVRALGLTSTEGGTDFTDTDGHLFEDDILRLSAAGITRGCNPPDNDEYCPDDPVTREQMAAFFHRAIPGLVNLTIAHINDHHSHLQTNDIGLTLGGEETDVDMGGFARVASKIKQIEGAAPNVLKVHAGDAITGTLFYTLFEGEADADVMNEVCFDVFEMGNHEFDDSDAGLAQFLDWLNEGNCNTALLGANIVPAPDTPIDGYLEPYTVMEYDGEEVGIIGIDIANKTKNSSQPLDTTEFLDEVETTQQYVDELEAMGVDRIIAVTHQQYDNDQSLARAVDGVDVIVGGDSHTLLGDYDQYGLNPGGPYPTMTTDAAGDPVCIVQAWQFSNVVGHLEVSWNNAGELARCAGDSVLLLGDNFTREDDVPVEGADLDAVMADINATGLLEIVDEDPDTASIISSYAEEVDELAAEVIGTAPEDLCFERIPGQGVSELCDTSETADHGGDIQQLVTEAFRVRSFESDIAIQNGGGVRVDVPTGDFSIADAYELLPFANTMVNIEMSGQEIVDVLNEAYHFAVVEEDASTGAYPYGAGIRWTTNFDTDTIEDIEVRLKGETDWSDIDLDETYTVVTNSFIASGQDGYVTFGEIPDDRKVDTGLDYAQTFIDYIEEDLEENAEGLGIMEKVPEDEYSTHNIEGEYTP